VHPKRHYSLRLRRLADPHLAPEDWLAEAPLHPGSWWPAWQQWLGAHSSAKTRPPTMGMAAKGYRALADAPGQYVHQR
jgi:polyhydroxyalkanoate synthase